MSRDKKRRPSGNYDTLKAQALSGSRVAARELLPLAVKRSDGEMAVLCVDLMFDRALLLLEINQGIELEKAEAIAVAAKNWVNGDRPVLVGWEGTFKVRYVARPTVGRIGFKTIFKLVPEGAPAILGASATPEKDAKENAEAIARLLNDEKQAALDEEKALAAQATAQLLSDAKRAVDAGMGPYDDEEEEETPRPAHMLPIFGYDDMDAASIMVTLNRDLNTMKSPWETLRNALAYERANRNRKALLDFMEDFLSRED